jgi:uncharacterized protein (DUF58 family)
VLSFKKRQESNKASAKPASERAGVHLSMRQLLQCQKDAAVIAKAPRLKQRATLSGGHESRFKGRGMDFDETRLYQPGDDIRSIDWNVTARTNKPHTKIYKEERERPIYILLDQSTALYFSTRKALKSTTLAQAAALLTWAALATKNRIGCFLVDEGSHAEFKPAGQRKAIMRIFNQIVEKHNYKVASLFENSQQPLPIEKDAWFSKALGRLNKVAMPGSLVYILSDFRQLDESAKRQLSRISRHCDVHAFCISDPIEKRLPPPGRYAVTDGDATQVISTYSKTFRENFEFQAQNFYRNLETFAQKHQINLLNFETGDNLTEVMRTSLIKFQKMAEKGR